MQENTTNNNLNNNEQPFDSAQGKLKELELKCEEYLNNWKRERADFLNYKKDEMERVGFLGKYVKEDIIFKILPIIDNIYLATRQNFNSENKSFYEGLLQIKKQAEEFLKKEGIEEIKTLGQKFDPNTMEAVAEAESSDIGTTEGGDEGTIVEELQKGYIMNDKVLRPAKVKVTK